MLIGAMFYSLERNVWGSEFKMSGLVLSLIGTRCVGKEFGTVPPDDRGLR